MNPFIFIAAVPLVAFVSIGLTYSHLREASRHDAEVTRKAATRGTGSAADGAGIGISGGNQRHA
jgi:hypothetical protein